MCVVRGAALRLPRMTISTQTRTAGPYVGTGAILPMPFGFKVFQASDLLVYRINADGTQTTLTLSVDYTVTFNGDQNLAPGGTVTPLAAVALGTSWGITSNIPVTQPLSLTNTGGFYPRAIEDELDRLTILLQQIGVVNTGQTLRVPETAGVPALPAAAARALKMLGFDALGNIVLSAPASGSSADLALALASSAATNQGAGLIGFNSALTYPAGTVGARLASSVSTVVDFGADPTGVGDSTAALNAAQAWLVSTGKRLVFPAGTYRYTESPNWAIANADIRAEGTVILKHVGTGNGLVFDAGTATLSRPMNIRFRGGFIVESNALAQNGVYIRSIHHSQIEARVRGCGPTYASHRIEFSVCNEYWFTFSGNEPFIVGAVPAYGIYCTRRNTGELTSANTFHNPIMEGVSVAGIYLDYAIMNHFIGGTSEGNTGRGVVTTGNSLLNLFTKLDTETNTLGDIQEGGIGNVYRGVYSDSTFTVQAGAYKCLVSDGSFNNIVDNGTASKFRDVNYASNAGTFTRNGTMTTLQAVWNNTGQYYIDDVSPYSIGPTTVTGVPNNTATTILTLPASTPGVFTIVYQVVASIPGGVGDPNNYCAYALIAVDTGVAIIKQNLPGVKLAISLSGLNVQVTQTSGNPQSITCKASKV